MGKVKNFFSRLFGAKNDEQEIVTQDDQIESSTEDVSGKEPTGEKSTEQNNSLDIQLAEKEEIIRKLREEKDALKAALETSEANKSVLEKETGKSAGKKPDDEYLDSIRGQLAEKDKLIEKYRKEKEALEDENDEKEIELKSVKKKSDNLKNDNETLKTELEETKSINTARKQELDDIKRKSEIMEDDLGIKTLSIGFVNEILNARHADDRDAEEIREKVEKIVYFVQNRVCGVFRNTTVLEMKELDDIQEEIERWGNLERKTWLKKKIVLAFVGEFSAGKTSIVNRIISQDKEEDDFKLPVSTAPTTAIATYISYGSDTLVQFTDLTGNLKNISIEAFKQFSKRVLEKINLSELVRHFVIRYNNQNLEKLSVLDTPGFSSNDKRDEDRTIGVIDEADALFWVVDAHTGEINESSLRIIREHMRDLPLYLVINKVDGKAPNERAEIKSKIKETMEKNSISIREYIEFSKTEPLENLMRIIADIAPRREESDIIIDLFRYIDGKIKDFEEETKNARKAIKDFQKDINSAERIIYSFDKDCQTNINRVNEKVTKLRSPEMLGNTLFGSGNKIRDPEEFWKLFGNIFVDINGMIELYNNYSNACQEGILKHNLQDAAEGELKDKDGKRKTLKGLKKEFGQLLGNYGYDVSAFGISAGSDREED
jgi:GTPase SAR1 family protein